MHRTVQTRQIDSPECFAWRFSPAHWCGSHYRRPDSRPVWENEECAGAVPRRKLAGRQAGRIATVCLGGTQSGKCQGRGWGGSLRTQPSSGHWHVFRGHPGLGSVFAGNTAATQAFIPHIDAALVVVGADPPIAGEELTLVEEVGRQVHEVIVVLNKADRTSDAERKIAESFTRKVLDKRLGGPSDRSTK